MSRGGVHNALPTGPLQHALSAALGDDVGTDGLERYGETLTPVVDIWRDDPSWAYYRDDILLTGRASLGATAGEYGAVALLNPIASGVLITVEQAGANAGVTSVWYLTRQDQAAILATYAGGGNQGYPRDSRAARGGLFAGMGRIYFGTDASSPYGYILTEGSNAANLHTSLDHGLPVILAPGQGIIVECVTVNTGIRAYFKWRERKALRGELV